METTCSPSEDFKGQESGLWAALLESLGGDGQEAEDTDGFKAAVAKGLYFVQESIRSVDAATDDPNHWYQLRKLAVWRGLSARLVQLDDSRQSDRPGSVVRFRSDTLSEQTLQLMEQIIATLEASRRLIPKDNIIAKLEGSRLFAEAIVKIRTSETDLYNAFEVLQDAIDEVLGHFWLGDDVEAAARDRTTPPPWLDLISALGSSATHFSDKLEMLETGNRLHHLYREVGLMRSAHKLVARYYYRLEDNELDSEFRHQVQVYFSRKLIQLSDDYLAQLPRIPPDDSLNIKVCCETSIKLCKEAVALFGDPRKNYQTGLDLDRLRALCGVRNRASLCKGLIANWQLRAVRSDLDEAFEVTTDLFEHVDLDSLGQVMDLVEYHEQTQAGLMGHPDYVQHLERVIRVYESAERLMQEAGYPLRRRRNLAAVRIKARADLSTLLRKRFISNGCSALGDITSAVVLLEGLLRQEWHQQIDLGQKTVYHLQLAHCYELRSAQSLSKEDQKKAIELLEKVLDNTAAGLVPLSLSDRCYIHIQLARNHLLRSETAVAQKEPLGVAEAALDQVFAHCDEMGRLDQRWDKRYRFHMLGQCYRKQFELRHDAGGGTSSKIADDGIGLLDKSIDCLKQALKWGRPWPDRGDDDGGGRLPTKQDILSWAETTDASSASSSFYRGPPGGAPSNGGGVYFSNTPDSKSLLLAAGSDITLMLNSKMSDWSNTVWKDMASAYESRSRYINSQSPDAHQRRQSDQQEALHFAKKCIDHLKCDLRTKRQAYETASKVCFASGEWEQTVAWAREALQLTQKLLVRSSSYADQIHASRTTQDFIMPRAVAAALLAGKPAEEALRLMEEGRGLFASFLLAPRIDLTALDRQQAFNYLQARSKFDAIRASLNGMEEGTSRWIAASNQCVQAEKELRELVSRIDALQNLLGPPSLADVRKALGDDTLVILNTSEARCDAFLVNNRKCGGAVHALELVKLKHNEVNLWAQRLRENRPKVSLALLSWLWETVAHPILEALGFLADMHNPSDNKPPSQLPRIHWILTGRMTQMPIHAAGLYRSTAEHRARKQAVMDCVVSSYTSSLKMYALSRQGPRQTIKIRKKWTAQEMDAATAPEDWDAIISPDVVFDDTDNTYVLLSVEEGPPPVAPPKSPQRALLVGVSTTAYCVPSTGRHLQDLPSAAGEIEQVNHALCKTSSLVFPPENITLLRDHQAKRQAVLDRLLPPDSDSSSNSGSGSSSGSSITIFHFAGHGHADADDPSKSSLVLSDGALTVSDLLKRQLPGGGRREVAPPFLGFLSACKTGTNDRIGLEDEGIHLIGAFQLAGFRHVVGTMWQVFDKTCPEVAGALYGEFGSSSSSSTGSSTSPARIISDESVCRGLHKALVGLRDKWLAEMDADDAAEGIGKGIRDVSLKRKGKQKKGVEEGPPGLWDSRARWVPFVHYGP